MNPLNFQNLSSVQSEQQPTPKTIASGATLGDVIQTFITFVTGTTPIATLQPPVPGQHMIVLIPTDVAPGGVTTGGNIRNAVDLAQYVPILLFWDPIAQRYHAK